MKKSFAFLIGLVAALAAAPAGAQQCARGQFYWKSKKTCVAKAEAARLGIYHGAVPKAQEQPAPSAPAPETAVAAPPAPPPEASPPPPEPEASSPPPPPSPYGELVLEEFSTAR